MDLPKRKPNRLRGYDYSQNGAYFITICTHEKQKLFWSNAGECATLPQNETNIVGECIALPQNEINIVGEYIALPQNDYELSESGKAVKKAIYEITKHYPSVKVDKFVIMPNHIHLILMIYNGSAMHSPTISTVIGQMKGYASKQLGFSPWQRSYHDHIIRDDCDYEEIWQYIENNPQKWAEDCFYME